MGAPWGFGPPPPFNYVSTHGALDAALTWSMALPLSLSLSPRFYTLLVLSTALFGKPPFKNVIVNGLVLARWVSRL